MATTAAADGVEGSTSDHVDLSWLPPVYVLATHLSLEEQHEAEDALTARGAPLTYDIHEAKVIFGNISKAQRARLELKWKGIHVEEARVRRKSSEEVQISPKLSESEPFKKKQKVVSNEQSARTNGAADKTFDPTCDNNQQTARINAESISYLSTSKDMEPSSFPKLPNLGPDDVLFIRLHWLNAAVNSGRLLPLNVDIILHARKAGNRELQEPSDTASIIYHADHDGANKESNQANSTSIIERARADPPPKLAYSRHYRRDRNAEAAKHDIVGKSVSLPRPSRPTRLLHQTTSEEIASTNDTVHPKPDWVLQHKLYSCERSTPPDPPNSGFIEHLKTIRLARELTLDQIGVRAYSTSIASLAAYPYPLQSSREVSDLPGCDSKIAHLFNEYKVNGQLQAVLDINADPALTCLRSFYDIWGVGAITAREFYYDRGWRDLDDIIEYGWKTLSRVQQIGLKYYDEFKEPLTRIQVEDIATTIAHHAALVTDSNIQTAIVGGYRRGKSISNDVDIILSHTDELQTLNLVTKVVNSLEKDGYITHTLTLNLTTTNRGQATLPISPGNVGHGFDSLDKALVVWQSPHWPTQASDLAANPSCKNPNPHRRVDIIISPWRTIGCAVAGWTSGTTFQRDLRRYCKYKKGWKFDSSGVRERGTGAWVDLEGYRDIRTRCTTWEEAEKKVFQGLGLEWRNPWERCTG